MSIDLKRFYATFFAESFAGLHGMEQDLLRLEQGSRDAELLNSIFRAIHSIKGAGGSLGFDLIAEFSHELETLLDRIRKGEYEPTADTMSVLLESVDCLRNMLSAAQEETAPDAARAKALKVRIMGLLSSIPEMGRATASSQAPAATAQPAPPAAIQRFHIHFRPRPNFFHTGNDPLRLLRVLEMMGTLEVKADLAGIPAIASFDPESCYLAWDMTLATDSPRGKVLEVFEWVMDDCELSLEPVLEQSAVPTVVPPPAESAPKASTTAPPAAERRRRGRRAADPELTAFVGAESLQVSTQKVDELVNLVGEVVITQTMLKQAAQTFESAGLESALSQLERNTRDLQQRVMAIRMLPVNFLFSRFARYVRDTAMQLGKKVELKISGEHSELDKTVIEKLIDPLTHLVRNALDHGIEFPEIRRAAAKPETATLALHAEHKGGNIVIEVRDDGQGINHEKIRARALEQGLARADDDLDEDALNELIFLPGFSTAEKVSDLSGRGVGMDVVRKNITGLGGRLTLSSTRGRGATFSIQLPLTLAILDGMSVGVRDENYIIPLTFILECIRPERAAIKTIGESNSVVDVRGEYVPILELGRLCGHASVVPAHEGILVLLEAENRKIALLVDVLLGQGQVVIKSLEANYRKVNYIAGATILGEGRVALILDVNALVHTAH